MEEEYCPLLEVCRSYIIQEKCTSWTDVIIREPKTQILYLQIGVYGFSSPIVAKIVDKYGERRPCCVGAVVSCLGLLGARHQLSLERKWMAGAGAAVETRDISPGGEQGELAPTSGLAVGRVIRMKKINW